MKSIKLVSLCSLAVFFICGTADAQPKSPPAQSTSASIESGKFRFYETKQPRGEETYQLSPAPDGEMVMITQAQFPFAEQETKPSVAASLRLQADFTPITFQIKGPTLLEIKENTLIEIQEKTANVEDRGSKTTAAVPKNFFTMSGYVP